MEEVTSEGSAQRRFGWEEACPTHVVPHRAMLTQRQLKNHEELQDLRRAPGPVRGEAGEVGIGQTRKDPASQQGSGFYFVMIWCNRSFKAESVFRFLF